MLRFRPVGRVALFAVAVVMNAGCANEIGAVFNRPIVEDSIDLDDDAVVGTLSVSADRRTVVAKKNGSYCAEPPPDAALSISSAFTAALESTRNEVPAKGTVSDEFRTTVSVLANRTPALDMFRTGTFTLCELHMNGAISDREVGPLFGQLIEAYVTAANADGMRRATVQDPAARDPAPAEPISVSPLPIQE